MSSPAVFRPGLFVLGSPAVGWLLGRIIRLWVPEGANPIGLGFAACTIAISASLVDGKPMALSLLLGWTLLPLAVIDIGVRRLPDVLTLPLTAMGLAVCALRRDSPIEHLCAAIAAFALFAGLDALYYRLRGRTGLGLGDAKLFAAAGALLNWPALPDTLVLACAGGFAWIAARVLRKGLASTGASLPFGAPLCVAIWISWIRT